MTQPDLVNLPRSQAEERAILAVTGLAAFAAAQQFAFACLVPVGVVAVGVALKCRGSAAFKLEN